MITFALAIIGLIDIQVTNKVAYMSKRRNARIQKNNTVRLGQETYQRNRCCFVFAKKLIATNELIVLEKNRFALCREVKLKFSFIY
jgi:hypothetical protein